MFTIFAGNRWSIDEKEKKYVSKHDDYSCPGCVCCGGGEWW